MAQIDINENLVDQTSKRINTTTGEVIDRPYPEWKQYSDESAIHQYSFELERLEIAKAKVGRWEQELMGRAAERGATTLYGKGMKYEIKTPNEYDRSKLPALVEFLTPEQKDKCITPAYVKSTPVPETHDMAQWKKAARENGGELAKRLEAATFPGKASGKLVPVATEEAE